MKTFVHDLPGEKTKTNIWGKLRVARASEPLQPNGVVRVVLAEDHKRVRDGLRSLLENTPDLIVVGEAEDGVEAVNLVEELRPDVLLLDIEMPRMNGPQVVDYLQQRAIPVKILALSAYDDRQYILGMLRSGACGYLTKEEAPGILVFAVRGVARGEKGWLSQKAAEKI